MEYSLVEKILGNGRITCYCFDGKIRIGRIRGKLIRRMFISVGDLILVCPHDYEGDKCDVLMKYESEEVRQLKNTNEIPESIKVSDN